MNLLQLAQFEATQQRQRADREQARGDALSTVNIALASHSERCEALLEQALSMIGVAAMAAPPNHAGRVWAAEAATLLGRGA